eukprot:151166-Ditylum_brightwellii.AAC.1
MVQTEDNSVQQQLTEMCDLIKSMQHQSVTPAPSVTPSPSPYPPQYYQPAANDMMQQQQMYPVYHYPMYPPMPMPPSLWSDVHSRTLSALQQRQSVGAFSITRNLQL